MGILMHRKHKALKNLSKVGLCLAIVAIMAPLANTSDVFKYESRGRRDPFVPLIGQERPAVLKLEDVTSIDDVKLEGIAVGPQGKKMAVLSGEMVKEGDKFGDLEIKEISKKEISLTIGGKPYKMNLSEEGGAEGEK
jgi:hypothetical protein